MTTDEVVRQVQMDTRDRCDACGSQAYTLAVLPSGGVLYFCNHHANQHGPGLAIAGATLQKDTLLMAGLNASRLVDDE